MRNAFLLLTGLCWLFFQCTSPDSTQKGLDLSKVPVATEAQVEALVEQFIEAEAGSTITIPEGYFELPTQLIIDQINRVTIQGAGMYKTVLSFKNLPAGGEGLKITGDTIVLENFTVLDAPGDCIKTQGCNTITYRGINTSWTHDDLSKSGTYGIYPVQCKNVLIEKCEVSRSRDAGIYVGQSENIIVRDNYVFENVAGIEIENCDNAEVYRNLAQNNTGGILVFNLPGLPKPFGSHTKIYENIIKENNHDNFALSDPGENGNPISMIPPGSGVIILAGDQVEVFNNQILNHKTSSVAIASYHITDLPIPTHPGWSPFSTNIYIHDNTYERTLGVPDLTKDLGKLIAAKCFKSQDVLYDGILDENRGTDIAKNPMNICVKEKLPDLRFSRLIIPASGKISEISVANDITPFNCSFTVSTAVNL